MDSLMTLAADPTVWAALATLIVMEVVLGIDNLIFISILSNKLPEHMRAKARRAVAAPRPFGIGGLDRAIDRACVPCLRSRLFVA